MYTILQLRYAEFNLISIRQCVMLQSRHNSWLPGTRGPGPGGGALQGWRCRSRVEGCMMDGWMDGNMVYGSLLTD